MWFLEFPNLLDMIHQVSSIDILHNKVKPVLEEKKQYMSVII